MPKTPSGATIPYASPADFLARVDARLAGDLVRDDGTTATPAQLLADPVLAATLADASGEVELILMKDQRYSAADLQALTGNGQALLTRIVCGVAVRLLRERRGMMGDDYPLAKWARERLEALASGAEDLPFAETEQAGLPDVETITAEDLELGTPALVSNLTRYFGERLNRRGFPRWPMPPRG